MKKGLKKFIAMVISMAIILAAIPVFAAVAESTPLQTIATEDFEGETVFSGTNATSQKVADSGSNVLKITQTSSWGNMKIFAPEKLSNENGKVYKISMKVKLISDDTGANTSVVADMAINFQRCSGGTLSPAEVTTRRVYSSDGWTTITADFALPPNAYFDYVNPASSGIFIYANPTEGVDKFIYMVEDAKVEVYDFTDATLGRETGNASNYNVETGTKDGFTTSGSANLSVVPASEYGGNGSYSLKVTGAVADERIQHFKWVGWDIMGPKKYDVSMSVRLLPKDGQPTTAKFAIGSSLFGEQPIMLSSDKGMQKIRFQVTPGGYGSDINMRFKDISEPLDFIVDDVIISSLKAPKMIFSDPADKTVAKTNNFMKLKVDNILRPQLMTANSILLDGSSDNIKNVNLQPDGSYLIEFNEPLAGGAQYTLGFNNAMDMYGRVTSEMISFTTKGVVYKPMLENTVPEHESVNVPINTRMKFKFDENLNFDTVNTSNVTVNGGTENIKQIHTDIEKPQEFEIEFQNLLKGETYSVGITGITHETQDVAIDDKTIVFTTESSQIISQGINGNFEGKGTMHKTLNTTTEVIETAPEDKERCGAKYLKVSQSAAWGNINFESLPIKASTLYKVSCDIKLLQKKNGSGNVDFTDISGASSAKNAVYVTTNLTSDSTKYSGLRADDGFKTITTYHTPSSFEKLSFAMLGWEDWGSTMWYDFLIDNIVVEELPPTRLLATSYPNDNAQNVALDSTVSLKFSDELKDDLKAENLEVTCNGQTVTDFAISKPTAKKHIYNVDFNDGMLGSSDYVIKVKNAKNAHGIVMTTQTLGFSTISVYDSSPISLYKNYGTGSEKSIEKVEAGEITAVIKTLKNNNSKLQKPTIILSLFEDNKMIDTAIKTVDINSNDSIGSPLTVKLTVGEMKPDKKYRLKATLVEDLLTIRPVGDSKEIN